MPPLRHRINSAPIRATTLRSSFVLGLGLAAGLAACQPKVQLVAPEKPIQIQLNVKIDQEVRVRLDKDVEALIADNPDLF